jgi:hypothetical protein
LNPSAETDPESFQFQWGERIYIRVINNDSRKLYFTVFRVDAAGKTTFVSRVWERGYELAVKGSQKRLVENTRPLEGLNFGWPKSVPIEGSIKETLVFIITQEEVDLSFLETATPEDYFIARTRARKPGVATRHGDVTYGVFRIPYELTAPEHDTPEFSPDEEEEEGSDEDDGEEDRTPSQQMKIAAELSAPEETKEWTVLATELRESAAASKGLISEFLAP